MGVWAFTYMSTRSTPLIGLGDVAVLDYLLGATSSGSGIVSNLSGTIACELQVVGIAAGQVFCISLGSTTQLNKSVSAT